MNFNYLDDMRRLDELTRPTRQFDELTKPMRYFDELTKPVRQFDQLAKPMRQLDELMRPIRQLDELTKPMRQLNELTKHTRRLDELRESLWPLGEEMRRMLEYGARSAAEATEGLGVGANVGFLTGADPVGLFSWYAPEEGLHSGFIAAEAEGPREPSQRVRLIGEARCMFCDDLLLSDGPELELLADGELRISMRTAPVCVSCLRREEKEPGWFSRKLAESLYEELPELRGIDGGREGDGIGIGKLVLVAPLADSDDDDTL